MKRKEFLKIAASGAIGVSSLGYLSCEKEKEIFFKLSLAHWSFHRAIQNGIMSPYTFAQNLLVHRWILTWSINSRTGSVQILLFYFLSK